MHYFLSEKEFKELVPKRQLDRTIAALAVMTNKVFNVSKLLAEAVPRNEDGWKGCVANRTTEYCTKCPALAYCPYDFKNWVK